MNQEKVYMIETVDTVFYFNPDLFAHAKVRRFCGELVKTVRVPVLEGSLEEFMYADSVDYDVLLNYIINKY